MTGSADLRLFIAIVDTGSITAGRRRLIWRWPPPARGCANGGGGRRAIAPSCPGSDNDRGRGGTGALCSSVVRTAAASAPGDARLRPRSAGNAAPVCQHLGDVGFLPGNFAAWMAAHPGIQIDTEERTSADIVSSILAGLAQAGVVSDAVDPAVASFDPSRRIPGVDRAAGPCLA